MITNSLLGEFCQLLIDRVCQTDHKTECVRGEFRSAFFRKELVKLRSYGVIAQVGIKLHKSSIYRILMNGISVFFPEDNMLISLQAGPVG